MNDAPIEFLLQHWPGVLFRQTPDFRFTYVGERIEAWTGCPPGEWLKELSLFDQCVHEGDLERIKQRIGSLKSAEGTRASFRFRHAATGRVTHVAEFRRAVCGPKGKVKFHEGFWQDESLLEQATQRLESASWAETVARLTPGFAHDFNNVIAGVHGLTDTFLSQIEPGHPFHDGLALVKKKTQEASQLVQRLQQLHLSRTGERAYHDLNAVVNDAAALLSRGLGKRLEIITELAPAQLPVHADTADLLQVVLALAFNAADAMPDRGRIILRTTAHTKATRAAHVVGTLPAGACVCFSIQDTGQGIRARQLAAVFDAGFTTKPGHQGLGLGLYHASRFAARHGGAISVESTEGEGSTFRLWLPRADFTEAGTDASTPRRRSVLLAGQPPRKLGGTAAALRASGVRVVIADGNAEELLAAPGLDFDAVVLRMASNDAEAARLVRFIRRHRLPVKLVIQPADCGEEDLDPKLLEKADLVLAESVSPERAAERITKELLAEIR